MLIQNDYSKLKSAFNEKPWYVNVRHDIGLSWAFAQVFMILITVVTIHNATYVWQMCLRERKYMDVTAWHQYLWSYIVWRESRFYVAS